MSEKTNIGWATSTFNPWLGCRRVSEGCVNCYMFELLLRWGKDPTKRTRTKDWKKVLKWNRDAAIPELVKQPDGTYRPTQKARPRVFPSLCDWLDDEVPIEWLADFLQLIHDTPNLDWLLLTKRPQNWESRMQSALTLWGDAPECAEEMAEFIDGWLDCVNMPERGVHPENVWLGVSVENQKRADERIPLLLQIPARIRFLSVEPLLEPVNLGLNKINYKDPAIHWIIPGGESGAKRRDCGVEALCGAARQGVAAGCAVFFKQDCAFKPGQKGRIPDDIWALKQFPV